MEHLQILQQLTDRPATLCPLAESSATPVFISRRPLAVNSGCECLGCGLSTTCPQNPCTSHHHNSRINCNSRLDLQLFRPCLKFGISHIKPNIKDALCRGASNSRPHVLHRTMHMMLAMLREARELELTRLKLQQLNDRRSTGPQSHTEVQRV